MCQHGTKYSKTRQRRGTEEETRNDSRRPTIQLAVSYSQDSVVDISRPRTAMVRAVDTTSVVLEAIDDLVGQRDGLHPSNGLDQLVLITTGAVPHNNTFRRQGTHG